MTPPKTKKKTSKIKESYTTFSLGYLPSTDVLGSDNHLSHFKSTFLLRFENQSLCKNLVQIIFRKLGLEPVSGESHLNTMLREEVFKAMATFGHKETQEELKKRFQTYINDNDTSMFPVDIKKAAYISIMRTSSVTDRSDFDSLLKLYRETDVVQEKTRILSCIATSPDPDIVKEVLNLMFTDEIREQDTGYVTARISLEGRETAWIWLKENWDTIIKRWGQGMLFHRFIRHIVTPFSSHEMVEEVEEFFSTRDSTAFSRNLNQAIEQIRIKAKWIQKIQQEEYVIPKLARGLTRSPMNT